MLALGAAREGVDLMCVGPSHLGLAGALRAASHIASTLRGPDFATSMMMLEQIRQEPYFTCLPILVCRWAPAPIRGPTAGLGVSWQSEDRQVFAVLQVFAALGRRNEPGTTASKTSYRLKRSRPTALPSQGRDQE
jgi:hypothetical protein